MKLNVEPRTIFCSDNLEILEGINSDCIDLIYMDPPFNKNKVFTAPLGTDAEGAEFSDIFTEETIKDEWVSSIRFENPELYEFLKGVKTFSKIGSGQSKNYNYCYLVYMSIRLIECQRILKNTGSLFLHCDPNMSHYLKLTLDLIFGEENFINEINWNYQTGGASKRTFSKKHDIIFFYSKSHNYKFNFDAVKVARSPKSLERAKNPKGARIDSDNILKGATDVWSDIQALNPMSKERTGYPTQKPVDLLKRIILSVTDEGDAVLDPFCGCATTCIAAENLSRDWIGIDVSHKAYDLVRQRLQKEVPAVTDDGQADMFRKDPNFSTKVPIRDKDLKLEIGSIYVISNSNWPDMFKVGIAKDVKRRLSSYQTSDPFRGYELEFQIETPKYKEIEKIIHKKFEGDYEWVIGNLEDVISQIKKEVNN